MFDALCVECCSFCIGCSLLFVVSLFVVCCLEGFLVVRWLLVVVRCVLFVVDCRLSLVRCCRILIVVSCWLAVVVVCRLSLAVFVCSLLDVC